MPTIHRRPRWRHALAAVYLASLAAAATTTSSAATTTSTAPEGPQTHTVLVGSGGDTQYHPNSLNASVGDIVSFQFYPTNHSVVRGEYTGSNACGSGGCNPCVPIELIDPAVPPFASKNFLTQDIPNPSNLALQSFNLTINDTNPIWFYCDAIGSCLNGMVGVINPANGSISKQVTAAQAAKFQLAPGQQWPAEGAQPGSQTATPSNPSTAPSSTASNSTASSAATTHDHHMTGGAIAGIAVGASAVVLLCAALCYFVGRANTYKDVLKSTKGHTDGLPSHYGDGTGSVGVPPPMSPVDPAMYAQSPPPPPLGGWDHRFSGQTQFSTVPPSMMEAAAPPPGTFMGYNRMTGAPEFAQEAPALGLGDGGHYHIDAKLTPPPGGYHAQAPPEGNVMPQQTHELPGETPPIAEVGPYN